MDSPAGGSEANGPYRPHQNPNNKSPSSGAVRRRLRRAVRTEQHELE